MIPKSNVVRTHPEADVIHKTPVQVQHRVPPEGLEIPKKSPVLNRLPDIGVTLNHHERLDLEYHKHGLNPPDDHHIYRRNRNQWGINSLHDK
jgi:hypothetical protein